MCAERARDETRRYIRRIASLILQVHPDRPRATPVMRSQTSCKRGSWSAQDLHRSGLYFKSDPDIARLGPRILVLPKVFLGQGIDVRRCALFGHAPDPTADLDVTIGIVGIDYRKRHRRAFPHIACLHTTFL